MVRRTLICAIATAALAAPAAQGPGRPDRTEVLGAMKRATVFMAEKLSANGGFVWAYLPDLSRRWGELEARASQIWIQPPGTASMGHLFLDAYHATGDEDRYYAAATRTTRTLMRAQHPSGGWNYLFDFAGPGSMAEWYATIGRNAWRMEEFQQDWDNATFDDAVTTESAMLLLRMYAEKREMVYRPALDLAMQFVLDSQYPNGTWPQRYPSRGRTDYTSFATFNDDVAAENVEFLIACYRALGDRRLLDPIARGMQAFVLAQQPAPQPGWALQYGPGLEPAGGRSYEPRALATHTTASNIQRLIGFYRVTGDRRFLARIPEALDWLERLTLPAGVATRGNTHPTFVEIGTNRPLYVHREGSNVVSGRYYVDDSPAKTLAHYSAFRRIDVGALRALYADALAQSPDALAKASPIAKDATIAPPPRFYAVSAATGTAAEVVANLSPEGYWPAPLGFNSHPFTTQGLKTRAPGDFSQTYVGDASDTSAFPDGKTPAITTSAYIRNMSVLIRWLDAR